MSRSNFIYLAKVLILFAIYFVTAKFGLNLQAVSRFAALIWIPTGFSLAILLLYGYRLWPGIALGAFFVNLITGAPFLVAVGIATGNTLEAVLGLYILKRFFDFNVSLSRVKDVLSMVLIATPISAAASATIGVSSLLLGGVIFRPLFITTWIPWWVGDVISVFIVTPFILLWSQKIPFTKKIGRVIELITLVFVVIFIGFFIFTNMFGFSVSNNPLIYLVYPPIIWASLRFGQREAATIIVIFSALATWETMQGYGPFAKGSVSESLLFLQIFMCTTAFTALVLSTVVAERRQLEERKDDFISMASHELRTPVTSLKLYTDIIGRNLQEKKFIVAKKYAGKLEDQVYKLTSLVTDLLDISRIQSGKLHIKKEPFNIDLLIADTVEPLESTSDKHTFIVKGKINHQIYGDRYRIYQVLVNLLTNAVKYSPNGGKIFIICKASKKMGQISIKDNGIGIKPIHREKIFEKLYQVEDSYDKKFSGLGIGLFVSAEIIKLHKGKIWTVSNKRKGTTFHFILPLSNS